MDHVFNTLSVQTSPLHTAQPNPTTTTGTQLKSTSQRGAGVSSKLTRTFLLECGLSATPQQRIANDVLVLEAIKEYNTRGLSRELLEMVVLKIGKHMYHGDSITGETHTVKRMLVRNHASISHQPPFEEESVVDNNDQRDHAEYQEALCEVYEYELSFKKIFAHFQRLEDKGVVTDEHHHHRRRHSHHHHHHHHFGRMTELQYKSFYSAVSLTPNLVDAETCHKVFHDVHADELGFEQFSSTMARLAMEAFSNARGKKKQEWLENKTGKEKVDLLVQFMNRRIAKYQAGWNINKDQHNRTLTSENDLRLLKDHTLEHQHNRRVLNLNPSMAEMFSKDQLEQGHAWLGLEMSSGDDSDSDSDSDSNDDSDDEIGSEDDGGTNQESKKARASTRQRGKKAKKEYEAKQEKVKIAQLHKRREVVDEVMDQTTQDLIVNLMKCLKNMRTDMRTMREERMLSLILHRWHTWVWHSKFRRMTQQGQAEHQTSALVHLAHYADEWKRRVMANALHTWYRSSQQQEAFQQLAKRVERNHIRRLHVECFVVWRDVVGVDREEKRVLRNFVMRWNNLELHRWFNLWTRNISHVKHVKQVMYRMLHAFMFRCFNYWQQYTSELKNAREVANARGNSTRFNRLHGCLSKWQTWAYRSKRERDIVHVMAMRRQHQMMRGTIHTWLSSMGKSHGSEVVRSHWDDMFDSMSGAKDVSPVMRHMKLMVVRNRKRQLQRYFDLLRKFAFDAAFSLLEQTEQALQFRKIRVFVLRKWQRRQTEFVFRSWVHATAYMKRTRHKVELLVAGRNIQIQQKCFYVWLDQTKETMRDKRVLHSFIVRLKNLSVNKTFNTWKEHANQSIGNREKLRRFVAQWGNKTVTNCLRGWKIFVKDRITVRTNLEGIDRYVLLERSVAAWRYLAKRRKLHQRTGRLIIRSTHTRIIRCVRAFFFVCFFVSLFLCFFVFLLSLSLSCHSHTQNSSLSTQVPFYRVGACRWKLGLHRQ